MAITHRLFGILALSCLSFNALASNKAFPERIPMGGAVLHPRQADACSDYGDCSCTDWGMSCDLLSWSWFDCSDTGLEGNGNCGASSSTTGSSTGASASTSTDTSTSTLVGTSTGTDTTAAPSTTAASSTTDAPSTTAPTQPPAPTFDPNASVLSCGGKFGTAAAVPMAIPRAQTNDILSGVSQFCTPSDQPDSTLTLLAGKPAYHTNQIANSDKGLWQISWAWDPRDECKNIAAPEMRVATPTGPDYWCVTHLDTITNDCDAADGQDKSGGTLSVACQIWGWEAFDGTTGAGASPPVN